MLMPDDNYSGTRFTELLAEGVQGSRSGWDRTRGLEKIAKIIVIKER